MDYDEQVQAAWDLYDRHNRIMPLLYALEERRLRMEQQEREERRTWRRPVTFILR
mgnify:CR=1 FL=1